MRKFACACGNAFDLPGVWPECEWRLVSMARVGEIADRLDAGKPFAGDDLFDLVEVSLTVYRCSVCSRLHLEAGAGRFDTYSKDPFSL